MGRKRKKKLSFTSFILACVFFLGLYVLEEMGYLQLEPQDFTEESREINDLFLKKIDREEIFNYYNISDIEFIFCNDLSYPCFNLFLDSFSNAKESIHCGVYELDDHNLSQVLLDQSQNGVDIQLVVDNRYYDEESIEILKNVDEILLIDDSKRKSRYDNYMHEKFCIIDESYVIFGTMNPSPNGLYFNDNVVVKAESQELVSEFRHEFNQFLNGSFGQNKDVNLDGNNKYILMEDDKLYGDFELLFCPQEECELKTLDVLNKSNESIYFATFVLTLDSVENMLKSKYNDNITIKGVVEPRTMNSKGSIITTELNDILDLKKDTNTKTMHHKLFIVDERYVIFGSMNPSNSGVNYNDEFLVIMDSSHYAQLFLEEFDRIYASGVDIE